MPRDSTLPCSYGRHWQCGLVIHTVPAYGLPAWLGAFTRAFTRFPRQFPTDLCGCTCHDEPLPTDTAPA